MSNFQLSQLRKNCSNKREGIWWQTQNVAIISGGRSQEGDLLARRICSQRCNPAERVVRVVCQKQQRKERSPVGPLHCQSPFVGTEDLRIFCPQQQFIPLLSETRVFGDFSERNETQSVTSPERS